MAKNSAAKTGINGPVKKGSGTFVTQQGKQGVKKGVNDVTKGGSVGRASGSKKLGVTKSLVPKTSNVALREFDRLLDQAPGVDFRPEGAGQGQSRTDHNGNGISG
jgi:hypothetical protein